MPNLLRKWWIWAGLLLVTVLLYFVWPRPIRIPLKDGTVLTISAITVGTEHRKRDPISWQAIKTQIARRQWGWPARVSTTPEPCVKFWIDAPKDHVLPSLKVVDRFGWEWSMSLGMMDGTYFVASFQPVETDGTVLLEVHGKDELLGSARVPLATAVPVRTPAPIPTLPPIPITFGEPASLPITRRTGPLEATLRSFALHREEGNQRISVGHFHLDTLWNGQPFVPEIVFLKITDRLGRGEMIYPQGNQSFPIWLPPRNAVWDLHFQIYRNLDTALDADEMVQVTPSLAKGQQIFQQEGSHQGHPWRLTFIPSGSASFPARFRPTSIKLGEDVPLIVVECDPAYRTRVRIEALDSQGEYFPAIGIGGLRTAPNIFAARSPDFDAAKGHKIQIGFDELRMVQFTIQPESTIRK